MTSKVKAYFVKQNRGVNVIFIAHLFNAPLGDSEAAVRLGTVGSSQAIKRKWQKKSKAEGKPYDKPNIVTGPNVHQMGKPQFMLMQLVVDLFHHFCTNFLDTQGYGRCWEEQLKRNDHIMWGHSTLLACQLLVFLDSSKVYGLA
ncbi:hypothetical protein PTKIN_Ptkin14bG0142200 [Pterospermum kingtungense]